MTTAQIDPRPFYESALGWVQNLLAGVEPEQLTRPTPCTELDVRALAGHLVATVGRARVIGAGGDASAAPWCVTDVADDAWAKAYGEAIDGMWTVWRGPEGDALLDRTVTAPFATLPGRGAVWAYLNETLVHGWDLATATGQDPEADPAVAEAALAAAARFLPASPRGGHVPFAEVVEPAAGAGATERLANWSGRTSR